MALITITGHFVFAQSDTTDLLALLGDEDPIAYSSATFKGKIENVTSVNIKKDGVYKTKISGNLDIHGVSKAYSSEVSFKVTGGKINAETKFKVKCADHNIKIEANLKNNISESIEVSAKAELTEFKK